MGAGLVITEDVVEADESGLVAGKHQLTYSSRVISDTPTLIEIESAFGFASEAGQGFIGVLDNGGNGTSVTLCVCDGTNWFYTLMTKAANN